VDPVDPVLDPDPQHCPDPYLLINGSGSRSRRPNIPTTYGFGSASAKLVLTRRMFIVCVKHSEQVKVKLLKIFFRRGLSDH